VHLKEFLMGSLTWTKTGPLGGGLMRGGEIGVKPDLRGGG